MAAASSHRLSVTTGCRERRFPRCCGASRDSRSGTAVDAYEREIQDSTADNPTTDFPIARRNWLRTDEDNVYLDPGPARCDALSGFQSAAATYYASRPEYGYDLVEYEYIDGHYCGSDEAVAYGTMISERKSVSGYGSFGYDLGGQHRALP